MSSLHDCPRAAERRTTHTFTVTVTITTTTPPAVGSDLCGGRMSIAVATRMASRAAHPVLPRARADEFALRTRAELRRVDRVLAQWSEDEIARMSPSEAQAIVVLRGIRGQLMDRLDTTAP
jgi:hypothetical protein